jgi:hypothetical protein
LVVRTNSVPSRFGLAAQVVDVHRRHEFERADALSTVRGVLSPTGLVSLAFSSVRELGLIPNERATTGSDIFG